MTEKDLQDLDLQVATQAEKETEAQLKIIRALKPLKHDSRHRVMQAALKCLLEAEAWMPGIMEAFPKGQKEKAPLTPKGRLKL